MQISSIPRFLICAAIFFNLTAGNLTLDIVARADGAPSVTVAVKKQQAASVSGNRLAHSNNPYLLLHAHNPVDWYPWGAEALARAKRENKPIFLSIGYSTCYWCHVAERTIYSNPDIAKMMNQWFINIKVDREQRPDLDEIYMSATQLLTGQGGWPNNLFLTPDLKPIFAGSYFPPQDDAMGHPGFTTILGTIHQAWINDRQTVTTNAERVFKLMRRLQQGSDTRSDANLAPTIWLAQARAEWLKRFDAERGGFSSDDRGVKFPQEVVLQMFLAHYRINRDPQDLEVVTRTLNAMALGGLYDHLGGGFHRYSVDSDWSVPHFEKMLYDNAPLLGIYTEAYKLTNNLLYRYVADDLRRYLHEHMAASSGGFYTAQDAEIEGNEGASYIWSRREIDALLGADEAKHFFETYTLIPLPHQNGAATFNDAERGVLRARIGILKSTSAAPDNIKIVQAFSALASARAKLLAARDRRPQPLRDEKIIVGLNGLAIEALAQSASVFQTPSDLALARSAAERIWTQAFDARRHRLQHEIFKERAQGEAYLDDYAFLGRGYLALYAATQESLWRQRAEILTQIMMRHFMRRDGTVLTTLNDKELLISPRDNGDNFYPSGTSAAVDLCLRLALITHKATYSAAAERVLRHLSAQLAQDAQAWPAMLSAVNFYEANKPKTKVRADLNPSKKMSSLATADHVRVATKFKQLENAVEVIFIISIDKGFHINANPASFDYLIPTSIAFDGFTPQPIRYPQATRIYPEFAREGLNVYQGVVQMSTVLPREILEQTKTLRATLSVQACTDQICLPPAKLSIDVLPVK